MLNLDLVKHLRHSYITTHTYLEMRRVDHLSPIIETPINASTTKLRTELDMLKHRRLPCLRALQAISRRLRTKLVVDLS